MATRRDFVRTLAVVGVAMPLLGDEQCADPALALVRTRYGQHVDEKAAERLATSLKELAASAERLRAVPLTNSDEPDFTFSALADRW